MDSRSVQQILANNKPENLLQRTCSYSNYYRYVAITEGCAYLLKNGTLEDEPRVRARDGGASLPHAHKRPVLAGQCCRQLHLRERNL
jgi:hypothetical protein